LSPSCGDTCLPIRGRDSCRATFDVSRSYGFRGCAQDRPPPTPPWTCARFPYMSVPCHVYVRVSMTSDSSPRLTILGQLTGKTVAPTPGVKPMLSGRGLFILAPATLLVESIQIPHCYYQEGRNGTRARTGEIAGEEESSEVVLTRDEGSSAASRAAAGCREFSHGPAAAKD
jgi:hypothetical protein